MAEQNGQQVLGDLDVDFDINSFFDFGTNAYADADFSPYVTDGIEGYLIEPDVVFDRLHPSAAYLPGDASQGGYPYSGLANSHAASIAESDMYMPPSEPMNHTYDQKHFQDSQMHNGEYCRYQLHDIPLADMMQYKHKTKIYSQ